MRWGNAGGNSHGYSKRPGADCHQDGARGRSVTNPERPPKYVAQVERQRNDTQLPHRPAPRQAVLRGRPGGFPGAGRGPRPRLSDSREDEWLGMTLAKPMGRLLACLLLLVGIAACNPAESEVQPFADPQPPLQRVVPQTPSLPENNPSGNLLPSAQSPASPTQDPQPGATHTRSVDVVVGDVAGVRGESVSINIVIDSQGQLVRGFQVNLTFDGTALPNAIGSAVSLPKDWIFANNLAGPGDLRFLGISSTDTGAVLSGDVLSAQFDIPAETAFGPITISTSLVDILHTIGAPLPVNVVKGSVIVIDRN